MSCLIDEGETFLLTGGVVGNWVRVSTVSRYNISGWIEDLGNLNRRRYHHGCTRYTNNEGIKVRCDNNGIFGNPIFNTEIPNIFSTRLDRDLIKPRPSIEGFIEREYCDL